MSRELPRAWVLAILLILPPAAAITWQRVEERRHYPRRFAEVVPGQVYRGGMPTADDVRRLKEEKSIRTVVNLTDARPLPEEAAMLAEVQRRGIAFQRFPMPGSGLAPFDALDRAADVIADPRNQPVFFHCAAGKQRSNAVLFAYRVRHDGWTAEKALAELEEDYELDPISERPLADHLRRYAARITAPGRENAGPAGSRSPSRTVKRDG